MIELHHSQQFLSSLSRTFLPDVYLTTLDGEGRVVSGHKHILATVSNKLKSLFLMSEGEVGPIMVRNIGFRVLERVVDFIYGANISVESVMDEEDVWDGLYILRMVDGKMGVIYRTVDSQEDGREVETARPRDPRQVLKKNVQVKIENISESNVCIDAESSRDQIEDIDTTVTEEIQKPANKRSRSSLSDYNESSLPDYSESHQGNLLSVELPKLYNCDECSFSSAYKGSTKRHQQMHLGLPSQKLYKCEECSFSSAYKWCVKRHQKIHIGLPLQKLYKCEECSYSAAYKGNLKKHRQKMHLFGQLPELAGEENNNTVTADDNVPTEEMAEMKKKVDFDNKFECGVCEKKFKSRNSLWCHKYKKHKEPKKGRQGVVVCELCDKTYKDMYRLLLHEHKYHQRLIATNCLVHFYKSMFQTFSLIKTHDQCPQAMFQRDRREWRQSHRGTRWQARPLPHTRRHRKPQTSDQDRIRGNSGSGGQAGGSGGHEGGNEFSLVTVYCNDWIEEVAIE